MSAQPTPADRDRALTEMVRQAEELGLYEKTSGPLPKIERLPAQPAPAEDDELREADRSRAQALAAHTGPTARRALTRLMAEYDKRGRELERLRSRDEKAAAVVAAAERWVAHMEGSRDVCMGPAADLIAAVDELARAHDRPTN